MAASKDSGDKLPPGQHAKGAGGGKHAKATPLRKQLGLPKDGREKPPPKHAK